jgi:aspartate--ammonia ligase
MASCPHCPIFYLQHVAPLAFLRGTGVNDELDGSESKSAVRFTVPNQDIPRGIAPSDLEQKQQASPYVMDCEIVQSLAKWKRIMLDRLDIPLNEGIYCDSTSIRKGYKGDVTHSVVADQWDYEIRITKEQRTVDTLQNYVRTIYKIITDAQDMILEKYPDIAGPPGHPTTTWRLPNEIHFTTPEELHAEFLGMDVHERENAAVRKYGAIFIMGMGWPLSDESPPEEVRSPGYDDWNLNGDVIVMHPLTEYRHELSSMGIRVDKDTLLKQLEHRGVSHEAELAYQKAVIEERLPFSYGGGVGISRLLMLLLRTCHIGEVQVGLWHDEHYKQAKDAGIDLIPDRLVTFTEEQPAQSPSPQ